MLTFSEWNIIQREENDQHTLHFGNQKINIHTYVGEFQPTAKHAERGCADFVWLQMMTSIKWKKKWKERGRGDCRYYKNEGAQGEMKSIYVYDQTEILLKLLLTSKRQLLICRGDGKGSWANHRQDEQAHKCTVGGSSPRFSGGQSGWESSKMDSQPFQFEKRS